MYEIFKQVDRPKFSELCMDLANCPLSNYITILQCNLEFEFSRICGVYGSLSFCNNKSISSQVRQVALRSYENVI